MVVGNVIKVHIYIYCDCSLTNCQTLGVHEKNHTKRRYNKKHLGLQNPPDINLQYILCNAMWTPNFRMIPTYLYDNFGNH